MSTLYTVNTDHRAAKFFSISLYDQSLLRYKVWKMANAPNYLRETLNTSLSKALYTLNITSGSQIFVSFAVQLAAFEKKVSKIINAPNDLMTLNIKVPKSTQDSYVLTPVHFSLQPAILKIPSKLVKIINTSSVLRMALYTSNYDHPPPG